MNKFLKYVNAFFIGGLIFISQSAFASQQTVLITGANRGVGLALAEKFHKEGFNVIATARKPEKADALKKMNVRIEQLDVVDTESVKKLAKKLSGVNIDILLNNAGIGGHSTAKFADLNIDQLHSVFDVNGLGALRVTQALIGNMKSSDKKVVASISSIMGSIDLNARGGVIGYRASKAALNSFNKSLAVEYASQGYKFVVLHPGWVRTDMGSDMATYSPEESANGLYKVITGLKAADNGLFYDFQGKPLKW